MLPLGAAWANSADELLVTTVCPHHIRADKKGEDHREWSSPLPVFARVACGLLEQVANELDQLVRPPGNDDRGHQDGECHQDGMCDQGLRSHGYLQWKRGMAGAGTHHKCPVLHLLA